jgi:hypothetical protein
MGIFRLALVALGASGGTMVTYRAAPGNHLFWVIGTMVAVADLVAAWGWQIFKAREDR